MRFVDTPRSRPIPGPEMSLILKCFFAFAVLFGVAAAAWPQSKQLSSTGVLLDGVAAVVNDGIVLRSAVDAQTQVISERIQQGGQPLPNFAPARVATAPDAIRREGDASCRLSTRGSGG